jgi:hypothetical protein
MQPPKEFIVDTDATSKKYMHYVLQGSDHSELDN